MNLDEAEKCIRIAEGAMAEGNFDKAEKFLQKSLKMHETSKAKALLVQCEIRKSGAKERDAGKQTGSTPNGYKSTSNANSTKAAEKPKEEEEDTTPKYTEEDVKLCKEIMAKKDYYEILSVTKTSTDDEIKKSYRKLALKLHPDKNRAPHSTEAFKKVSTAFACLSDKQKRTIYDEHGTEENFRQNYGQYFREEEFNPEDIFEAFFGGLFMNGNNVYRQRGGRVYTHVYGNRGHARQRAHHDQGDNRNAAPRGASVLLLQFMPFILLIVLSMLANFTFSGTSSKLYSFNRSSSYPYPEKTKILNLQFFVSEDYLDLKKTDPYKIAQIEKEIEVGEYSRNQNYCAEMKTQQRVFYQKARNSYTHGQEEYWRQKAESVDLTSCTRADEYYKKLSVARN